MDHNVTGNLSISKVACHYSSTKTATKIFVGRGLRKRLLQPRGLREEDKERASKELSGKALT